MDDDRIYKRCYSCGCLRKSSWFLRQRRGVRGCKKCGSLEVTDPSMVRWYERIQLLLGVI